MTLHLKCPQCGRSDPADSRIEGRKVRCRTCGAVFQVTNAELSWLDESRTPGSRIASRADDPVSSEDRGRSPTGGADPSKAGTGPILTGRGTSATPGAPWIRPVAGAGRGSPRR